MKKLWWLITLPVRLVDDALEWVIFRVLFHPRLWFINLPAFAALCYFGWTQYQIHFPRTPAPSASASAAASGSPSSPSPAPRSPSQASPTAPVSSATAMPSHRAPPASVRPDSSPGASPTVRPTASAVAPPKPRPSPRVAVTPSPVPPTVAPPPPTPRPSPTAAPVVLTPLLKKAGELLRSVTAGPWTTEPLELLLAVGRAPRGQAALVFSQLRSAPTDGARQLGALGGLLCEEETAAAVVALPDLDLLDEVADSTEAVRLIEGLLRSGTDSLRSELLTALAQRPHPVPAGLGPRLVGLLSGRGLPTALRERVARCLARCADRSLGAALVALMHRSSPDEKAALARALAGAGHPSAKDALTDSLGSRNNGARANALHGLALLPEPDGAATAVTQAIEDSDYEVRLAAAHVMVEAGEERGLQVLATDLASPLDPVWISALAVVSDLSEARFPSIVRQLVSDRTVPSPVRRVLLELLAGSPYRGVAPALQELVASRSTAVRRAVARGLHREQARLLGGILLPRLSTETSPEVRLFTAGALLAVHPQKAHEVLVATAGSDPHMRRLALRMLARTGAQIPLAWTGGLPPTAEAWERHLSVLVALPMH